MKTVHNTDTDDLVDVPDFVAEKLLKEGKVQLCQNCGMYHTDDLHASHRDIFYEATNMGMN